MFVLLDHTHTIIYHISAATTSFNAVDNISELFGGVGYVNGQEVEGDAHSVAGYWGGISIMWASLWFVFALGCSSIGLIFALDGSTYKKEKQQQQKTVDDKLTEAAEIQC